MSRIAGQDRSQRPAGQEVAERPNGAVLAMEGIEQFLAGRRNFIEKALDRHLDLDVFMGRVLNVIRQNPDLLQCTHASLMASVVTMAQLGLEPGPLGHMYLTPRRNRFKSGPGRNDWSTRWEVVPVIGYKGYIALGRRAGGMSIDADDRCENDLWIYQRGTDPKLITAPPDRGERGERLGYWAAAAFDGGSAAHYMSMLDLEEHARKHASDDAGNPQGFAKKNWEGWCLKTVVRQMAWKLPQSTQLAVALERDESSATWRDDSSLVVVNQHGTTEADAGPLATPAAGVPVVDSGGFPINHDPSTEPGYTGGE